MKFISLIYLFLFPSLLFAQRQADYVDSTFTKNGDLQRVYVEYYDSVNYDYEYQNGKLISFTVDSNTIEYTYKYADGIPISYEASYSNVRKTTLKNGYDKTVRTGYMNLFREFHPNGNLKKEYYERYTINLMIISTDIDTIKTWHENGVLESVQIYSDAKDVYSIYSLTGNLKMRWDIDGKNHSVKQYNSKGEILGNGDFNSKGTGYLNHYNDDGILDGKCYYKKGKLIPKKCS